jgi:hypothetical protein
MSLSFPLAQVGPLFHVGTLNPALRGQTGPSHEGAGLSVSTCPEAWRKIARLGALPTHAFTREHPQFLDIHALTPLHRQAIGAWAVEAGWATPGSSWELRWFDDELNAVQSCLTADRDEALDHAEEHGVALGEWGPEAGVREQPAWWPTSAYVERMGHGVAGQPSVLIEDGLAVLFAAHTLGWDGAYWHEPLNPSQWSAPRGVIVPERLHEWTPALQITPPLPRRPSPRPGRPS